MVIESDYMFAVSQTLSVELGTLNAKVIGRGALRSDYTLLKSEHGASSWD